MARVTVEDCIDKVENRFDLVLLASHRARMISSGSQITVDRDNDKNPVVALREIAAETVALDHLQNALIKGMQKHVEIDEPEEDRQIDPSDQIWSAVGRGDEPAIEEELKEDMLFVEDDELSEDAALEPDEGDTEEG